MKLIVNGQERELPTQTTVAELLRQLDLDHRTVAVERNLELVPRSRHAQTELAEGDRLELVTLVGGG